MMKITLKPNQEVFFTSDIHWFHENVIKYSNRPFSNIDEMNSSLLKNINEKVGFDDYLFILGDVSFENHHKTIELLKKIKCKKKFLILGNHDKYMKKQAVRKYFIDIVDYKEILIMDPTIQFGQQIVVMSHFPMLTWNKAKYGSWMLHGHSHGQLTYPAQLQNKKIMDVGVDPCGLYPISYTEIKEKFKYCENGVHHGD